MYKTFLFLLCLCIPHTLLAKDIKPEDIDTIVMNVMDVFSVPGAAVGVIQNSKVIHSKGYGVRALNKSGAVDENTYFGIASNSKGFTATALAILVDQGKITWDDKVKEHLPDFEMHDPWVADHFTIRDLLIHSTGLPLGSGDLMWWPDANFSPDEIIKNMRHLKPNREFRTTYEYNNMPFIVAGAIIPSVTGKSYEEFLQENIFDPLGMDRCTANTPTMANDKNLAEPHAVLNGELKQINRYLILDQVVGSMAAAGIQCSIDDLLKWEQMHLNNGEGLMSKETHNTLWQIYTPMKVSDNSATKFRGYGLGYNISDYHGLKVVAHGGALIGMYSNLVMVPERDFAIAIVTNQQSGDAYAVIRNQILNHILDIQNTKSAKDLFNEAEARKKKEADRLNNLAGSGTPPTDKSGYIGNYSDNWWGNVTITDHRAGLYFISERSPSLKGEMNFHKTENQTDIYFVRWDDRTHEADAFVIFHKDINGNIQNITMKAISPRTDFSYDFHHVNLVKQ